MYHVSVFPRGVSCIFSLWIIDLFLVVYHISFSWLCITGLVPAYVSYIFPSFESCIFFLVYHVSILWCITYLFPWCITHLFPVMYHVFSLVHHAFILVMYHVSLSVSLSHYQEPKLPVSFVYFRPSDFLCYCLIYHNFSVFLSF